MPVECPGEKTINNADFKREGMERTCKAFPIGPCLSFSMLCQMAVSEGGKGYTFARHTHYRKLVCLCPDSIFSRRSWMTSCDDTVSDHSSTDSLDTYLPVQSLPNNI